MKLADIAALIEGATPGPWKFVYEPTKRSYIVSEDRDHRGTTRALFDNWHNMEPDARLMTTSRTLLPKLLRVAEAAKEAGHGPWAVHDGDYPLCKSLAALEADAP